MYTHYKDGFWESYEYNKAGQLIEAANTMGAVQFTRNALGQVTKEESEHGHTVAYQYNAQGKLQGLSSSPGAKVEYTYDTVGYLEQVLVPAMHLPLPQATGRGPPGTCSANGKTRAGC